MSLARSVFLFHIQSLYLFVEEQLDGDPVEEVHQLYREPLTPVVNAYVKDSANKMELGLLRILNTYMFLFLFNFIALSFFYFYLFLFIFFFFVPEKHYYFCCYYYQRTSLPFSENTISRLPKLEIPFPILSLSISCSKRKLDHLARILDSFDRKLHKECLLISNV